MNSVKHNYVHNTNEVTTIIIMYTYLHITGQNGIRHTNVKLQKLTRTVTHIQVGTHSLNQNNSDLNLCLNGKSS